MWEAKKEVPGSGGGWEREEPCQTAISRAFTANPGLSRLVVTRICVAVALLTRKPGLVRGILAAAADLGLKDGSRAGMQVVGREVAGGVMGMHSAVRLARLLADLAGVVVDVFVFLCTVLVRQLVLSRA